MDITWKKCFRVALSAFLLFLCIYYWAPVSGILGTLLATVSPIFIGLAIAYVLNILMSFYEKHYFKKRSHKKFVKLTRRPVCLTAAILTLIAIVVILVWLVLPELISCVRFLINEIPPAIDTLLASEWIGEILPQDIISRLDDIDWNSTISNVLQTLGTGLDIAINAVVSVVSSVVSAIFTTVIGIIFSIYLLYGKERFQNQAKHVLHRYLAPVWENRILHTLAVLNDCFRRYIVGQCVEAAILGLLCTLGMLIFRFPYAGMIGALIGFTALIPVAGAYIGAAVGALMIMTVSPLKALLFLVFIVVLQQLEGNLIYPKVVGSSLGLPAIWVLAAVTVGGGLMGVAGMMFGVPLAAALYRLLREDLNKKEAAACG